MSIYGGVSKKIENGKFPMTQKCGGIDEGWEGKMKYWQSFFYLIDKRNFLFAIM